MATVAPLHPQGLPDDDERQCGALMARIHRDGEIEVLRGSLAHRLLESLRQRGEVRHLYGGSVYVTYEST